MGSSDKTTVTDAIGTVVVAVIALALVVFIIIGALAGSKAYGRWEARNDARNQVEINRIKIRQHEQLVEIEEQEAERRIVEAQGIAESQAIIDSSLTEQYLLYLAIQAQERMSESPNHTTIYIPTGELGVPLVRDTAGDESP